MRKKSQFQKDLKREVEGIPADVYDTILAHKDLTPEQEERADLAIKKSCEAIQKVRAKVKGDHDAPTLVDNYFMTVPSQITVAFQERNGWQHALDVLLNLAELNHKNNQAVRVSL